LAHKGFGYLARQLKQDGTTPANLGRTANDGSDA